jgi:predicted nucleic acid-binding protein
VRRLLDRQVYLDSNILIYLLDANPTYLHSVERILTMAANGAVRATTGDLTVTEILVRPLASHDQAAVDRITGFLDSGLVDVRSHTREAFELAARIRADHRTSLPDALHAATALTTGCTVLVTNDARMPSVRGLEVVRLQELEQLDG